MLVNVTWGGVRRVIRSQVPGERGRSGEVGEWQCEVRWGARRMVRKPLFFQLVRVSSVAVFAHAIKQYSHNRKCVLLLYRHLQDRESGGDAARMQLGRRCDYPIKMSPLFPGQGDSWFAQ